MVIKPEPKAEERAELERATICPICYEYGHPEIAHQEAENEARETAAERWYLDGAFDFDSDEPEPMSLEDEMQNYPERFWENPDTGEWERW
jgi:hypothetical protein